MQKCIRLRGHIHMTASLFWKHKAVLNNVAQISWQILNNLLNQVKRFYIHIIKRVKKW